MDHWRDLLDRQHLKDVQQLSWEPLEKWGDESASPLADVYEAKRALAAKRPHAGDCSAAVLYRNPDGSVTDLADLLEAEWEGERADLLDAPGIYGRKRGQDGWIELGPSAAARRDFLQVAGWREVGDVRLGEQSHTCAWCERRFTAKRRDAKTCRPSCRKALSRARKRVTHNRKSEEPMITADIATRADIERLEQNLISRLDLWGWQLTDRLSSDERDLAEIQDDESVAE